MKRGEKRTLPEINRLQRLDELKLPLSSYDTLDVVNAVGVSTKGSSWNRAASWSKSGSSGGIGVFISIVIQP